MNINLFFIVLIALLLSVFVLFKPLKLDLPDHKEIAQLELKNFHMYEIEQKGVKSILEGITGERYENRYEVKNVTFKDTSKGVIEVMHADFGRFQEDIVYLKKNVIYAQENGISFNSDEAKYDLNNSILTTQGDFVMRSNEDYFKGKKLRFNTKENIILAKEVTGSYQLEKK
jgi:LPS export ABC transporter protein LptC